MLTLFIFFPLFSLKDAGDVTLPSNGFTFFATQEQVPVSFTFTKDSIAQERNETFALNFVVTVQNPIYNGRLVNELIGTILDDDREFTIYSSSYYTKLQKFFLIYSHLYYLVKSCPSKCSFQLLL